jgi:hypothetical protein
MAGYCCRRLFLQMIRPSATMRTQCQPPESSGRKRFTESPTCRCISISMVLSCKFHRFFGQCLLALPATCRRRSSSSTAMADSVHFCHKSHSLLRDASQFMECGKREIGSGPLAQFDARLEGSDYSQHSGRRVKENDLTDATAYRSDGSSSCCQAIFH